MYYFMIMTDCIVHIVLVSPSHKLNNSHKKSHIRMLHYHHWSLIYSKYGLSSFPVPWDRSRKMHQYCVFGFKDARWPHVAISYLSCAEKYQTCIYLSIFLVPQSAYDHWCEYVRVGVGCKLNKPACASPPYAANLNTDTSLTYTEMQLFAFWNVIWLKCWKTFHVYSILTVKKWFKLM